MKKLFNLAAAVAAVVLGSCGNSNDGPMHYSVDFDVTGVADSTEVVLRPVTHDREAQNVSEGVLIAGKLRLTGEVEEPTAVYVKLKNGNGLIPIILDNSSIKIFGEVLSTPSRDEAYVNYDFSQLTVTGSPLTDKYRAIYAVKDSMSEVRRNAFDRFRGINMEYGKARMEKDDAKIKEIEASDAFREMQAFDEEFMKNLENVYQAKILEGKDSFWGPVTMLTYYIYFIPSMRPLYEQFSDEAKNTTYGQMIRKELYPVGVPGDKLSDFSNIADNGDSVSMYGLAGKNRYMLIDFWASWCGPCRKEIPNLRKLYDKYRDKGFDILSVSIDKEDDAWRKALKDEQLPWTNCRDTEGDIAKTYGVQSIPMLVVVDAEGRLVVENLRGEELENRLEELLSEK